jgi:hypothetical protein
VGTWARFVDERERSVSATIVYGCKMGRLLVLGTLLVGCTTQSSVPDTQKPVPTIAGDATCAATMTCYQECGGHNYGCDRLCNESATIQAQHDSATLMRCLFDHACYDQTCVDTFCGAELAVCRPTLAPVSGSLVVR